MNSIYGKLIKYGIFVVIGTSYLVYRLIRSAADKRSVHGLINAIQKHTASPSKVADALDIPYGKSADFLTEDFEKLKSVLKATTIINDYTILYQAPVDRWRYLLFTEIRFSDYDIGVTGNATDVKKIAYHSFVLRFDPANNTLSVFSDLYDTTTSRFQKEAFSRGIRGI